MSDEYKTADDFIADILSSNYFKDNPHIVDEVAIYRWLFLALKQFGLNIMQKQETTVKVKGYRGYLPKDFGRLALAVHCTPCKVNLYGDQKKIVATKVYRETIQDYTLRSDVKTENCEYSCEDTCPRPKAHIIENITVEEDCRAEVHFSNYTYVKLGRDVIQGGCTSNCINQTIKDSPYSINIKGKEIHANFEEGYLYVQYYALPTDDNGVPLIPSSKNGRLETYLEYHIKSKILEDAWLSKDTKDVVNLMQYFKQEERIYLSQAKADVSPTSLKDFWNAISVRRSDMRKYRTNLGAW